MPMQYTTIFHGCKNDIFQLIFFLYISYFCSKNRLLVLFENIDCGYRLEPPQRVPTSFVEIGLPVPEKNFEGFLPYRGVAAILVM